MLLHETSCGVFLVVDDDLVLLSGTGLVEGLDFLFAQLDFVVLASSAPADGRAEAIDFLTPAVVVFAALGAVAPILVDLHFIDEHELLLEGLAVDSFGFVDHKLPGILVVLGIQTVLALAARPTVAQFFEAGTVEAKAVRVLALAALHYFLDFLLPFEHIRAQKFTAFAFLLRELVFRIPEVERLSRN